MKPHKTSPVLPGRRRPRHSHSGRGGRPRFPWLAGLPWRAACCGLLLGTAAAPAQVVVWDVNGKTAAANHPLPATLLDSHWSAGTLALGPGVSASGTANTFGAFGFDQTSLAAALADGDHLTLTLTPAAGSTFSLASLTVLLGVGTAVTNFNVALTSDRTGFTAEDVLWTFAFGTASPPAQTIALAGFPSLADLASAVEFRLYGWRDTAGTTTFRFRDNAGSDVAFAGAGTAIPEPAASAGLLGAGGLGLAFALHRRRRRRSGVR